MEKSVILLHSVHCFGECLSCDWCLHIVMYVWALWHKYEL